MVAQRMPQYMTVNEWRKLEEQSTVKHEYIAGRLDTPYLRDEVELTSIDVHLPLAALYEGTDVPEIVEVPTGEL